MSDQTTPGDRRPTVFKDRYELHRRLARGGMSDVFLARDLLLDRPVAVKVLFPEYAKDPTFVERFRREAQAAARLSHGHIVGIYDWGEEFGTSFIAMEYVEGRSLSEVIRAEGPLEATRAAGIAADVADALGSAHHAGVVHRDVKPGNVMITSTGTVKVADFGIAQAVSGGAQSNLTQTGAVMGTATYFSPEQAQGKPVDPRSDLYSLGCVLYEMLTGQPPFSGDSPVAIAYKHVQEPPVPPGRLVNVPEPLEAIVMKLLQKEPANRYPDAAAARDDLRRFVAGQPVQAAGVAGAAAAGATAAMAQPTTAVPVAAGPPPASDYEEEYYEEPGRSSGWLVAITVLLLAILGIALFLVASSLSNDSAEQVRVPSVVDLDAEEATRILQAEGFEVEREEEPNEEKEAGIVLDQDPGGGSMADVGSTVTITVSVGLGETEVPRVEGLTEDEARQALEDADLVAEVERVPHEEIAADRVIRQDPRPNETVQRGSAVKLTVSSGKEMVTVPNVVGQSQTTAANRLGQEGFSVDTGFDSSDTVEEGLVIRTNPPGGTEVERGSQVTIVISTGPAATTTTSTSTTSTSTTASTTTSTTVTTTTSSTDAPEAP